MFFPIYSSNTIGMGVIYLITNRVNKQINKIVTNQVGQNQLRQFRSF